jgi:hypothetical protein
MRDPTFIHDGAGENKKRHGHQGEHIESGIKAL